MANIAKPDTNGQNAAFDTAYWASQPPPVQTLKKISDYDARRVACIVLAEQGYLIDGPIMMWNWDPFKIMEARIQYGYTSVPSLLGQMVVVAPGVTQPGNPIGPGADGQIPVSLDFDKYPPYKAPAPILAAAKE
jgi:hypothetical protein